jgi:hypothetical protein
VNGDENKEERVGDNSPVHTVLDSLGSVAWFVSKLLSLIYLFNNSILRLTQKVVGLALHRAQSAHLEEELQVC